MTGGDDREVLLPLVTRMLGLGRLPAKLEPVSTLPQEGHVCEFPLWAFSKKRSTVKELNITYEDSSFLTIKAPEGMPGPRFPGYLDVILFYGQRDLFLQDHTSLSVYSILKTLQAASGKFESEKLCVNKRVSA